MQKTSHGQILPLFFGVFLSKFLFCEGSGQLCSQENGDCELVFNYSWIIYRGKRSRKYRGPQILVFFISSVCYLTDKVIEIYISLSKTVWFLYTVQYTTLSHIYVQTVTMFNLIFINLFHRRNSVCIVVYKKKQHSFGVFLKLLSRINNNFTVQYVLRTIF